MDRTAGVIVAIEHYRIVFQTRKRQMGMIEELVWVEFVKQYGARYERIGENVPVWLNPQPKRGAVVASKQRLQCFGCYRVDAVVGDDGLVELIEVKEVGNMTAIGQLLTYRMLFNRTYWGYAKLEMRLVCLRAPSPIRFACGKLGIEVTEIGDAIDGEVKSLRRGRQKNGVSC